jgi:hypothetical protein
LRPTIFVEPRAAGAAVHGLAQAAAPRPLVVALASPDDGYRTLAE